MLIKDTPVEIADGLWMLGTSEYPVFLAMDQNEGAIFEGGVGADGPLVTEQLTQLDIAADSVKQVIITHAHPDHVMAIPAFRAMFDGLIVCGSKPAAKTLAIEKAVRFFSKIDGILTESLIKTGSITEEHRPELFTESQITVDRILADGDTITVGGLKFDVLAMPGHSDCSLSFHEPGAGFVIVSDATGFYIPDHDYWWPGYFTDYEAYLESMRRLADLGAKVLCLSHNGVIKGSDEVRAYFDAAIAATEAYHKRILTGIETGKSPEELAGQLGTEVYEKIGLLPLDFFQKNCALLIKQSMEYAQKNNRQ
ncbi:MAG: MBL fold metallo-hydrolase [Planctomycetota bacterium]|jgi:glyoxylase-like metal-dependent hydrolase (beta-lactamase superfamily II)